MIEKVVIRLTPLPDKLEFARRAGGQVVAGSAGGQVVRQICVVVSALTRSVSLCGSINWYLTNSRSLR